MEIQQHDGVVVEAAGISAGLHQATTGGGGGVAGEREAPRLQVWLPSLPPPFIYAPRGAPALGDGIS